MVIENNCNTMHLEVTIGLNFIRSYLYDKLPRRRVNMFGEEMEKQIKLKFLNHWHTDKIFKDSGYRCLKLTSDHIDSVFIKAAQDSGLELQEIVKNLPQYFVLWIDPGEISYRLIDKGPVRILYEEDSRLKLRHKKLENIKDNLIQNRALNYRAHHHHHTQLCIDKFSNSNNYESNDAKFLINDDDTFSDPRFDAYAEECSCYFDFEFTYDNDTNNNINGNTTTSMISAVSTPSLLSNAFSTNDLNLLQFQNSTLNLNAPEPSHSHYKQQQQQPQQNSNNNNNQFNPDAETFKPMLMNSHSGTSLANSKAYKSNIFSSTHNISKSFGPFGPSTNTNLPSLQPSFSIQSLSQQNNYSQQQQQQQQLQNQLKLQQQAQQLTQQIQSQQQQQQQQQKQRASMQRLLNTSIDSLNSPFNSLSLASPSLMNLSLANSNVNQNSSMWCLPSSVSPNPNNNNNNNNNLLLPASTTPPLTTTNITINDVTTPVSSLSPSLSPGTTNSAALLKSTTPVIANPTFTAHSFANTKFGSTKTKSTNRRSQKMLPSEFSAYIKQKAQIQQLQKSPQITSKPPFGMTSSPTPHQQQQNSNSFQTNGIIGSNGYNNQFMRQTLGSLKSPGPNPNLLMERSFSNTVGDNISPPIRSISISNTLGTNDLFNFDLNMYDTPHTDHNSLLSPQPYQQQQQPLNTILNDFGLLINNNSQNYGTCASSSSSDSSSVGSSFLSDSKSPPLQLTSSLSITSKPLMTDTIPTAITRKHSFNNFNKSSNDNSLNFYNSNQANSNVSTNNSLVAGFANIAATQQIQTNHSNNIYNNKYNNNNNNIDVFNNFLRFNTKPEPLQTNLKSGPSRPNSLFLHLQYDNKDSFENINSFYENDDQNHVNINHSDDDDMPKYFTQYDNIIECELEPEINGTNNADDFNKIYSNASLMNSTSPSSSSNNKTNDPSTEVTTNSSAFKLLMAN